MQRWDFSDRAENEAWPHCLNFPVHLLINTDSAEWILPSLCKQMAWVQFTSIIDSNLDLQYHTAARLLLVSLSHLFLFWFVLFYFVANIPFQILTHDWMQFSCRSISEHQQTLSEHSIDASVKFLYFTAMSFCYLFIWVLVRLPKFLWKT